MFYNYFLVIASIEIIYMLILFANIGYQLRTASVAATLAWKRMTNNSA